MNTTIKIAKLELSTLFYSPIAWFLAVVFLFQCGLAYTSVLQMYLAYQEHGGEQLKFLNYLTNTVFGFYGGLYGSVLRKIYLYLPLLTMGLISREVSSGTIKLLYSSPVKVSQIVLGKFMAMVVYNLLLVLLLVIFGISGLINIPSADLGFIFPGLIAVFLLLCTYAAIGLFMSSLTAYQIVAAISTLVVFAVLDYIGTIWQDIDFVRNLTYFLSISGRAEHILFGLVSTKDIFYFVIIIAMFLTFCVIRLQAGRTTAPAWQVAGKYIAILSVGLIAGYITSQPGMIGYYDGTAGKYQTLTPNTQKIIKELGDEPLEVTSYINLLDRHFYKGKPDQRNMDLDRWEQYLRFKPNIKLNYVYYYDMPGEDNHLLEQFPGKSFQQIAQQIAASYKTDLSNFKSPAEIRKIIDLQPENNSYVMQLRFKGKTTFLRLFNDQAEFPSETETAAALKRLTVTLPKIVFVTGEYERSKDKTGDKDYGVFVNEKSNRYALINQGFDTDTVMLDKQDIPPGIAALIIADPKSAFTPAAMAKIQQYIDNGGNLLIAGEPGKQVVINPLLQRLGVQLMDGTIIQQSKDDAPNLAKALLTPATGALSKTLGKDLADSIGVTMPGATGLSYDSSSSFHITPMLVTDAKTTWLKKGPLVLDSAAIAYNPANGDSKGSIPTALSLTRQINGKEQRIVVTGDADFLSTAEMKRWPLVNLDLCAPLMGWFTYGAFPIETSHPDSKDNRMALTYSGITTLKVIFLGILPGLLSVGGAIFLIRRKRK